jgi:hypothetical protein
MAQCLVCQSASSIPRSTPCRSLVRLGFIAGKLLRNHPRRLCVIIFLPSLIVLDNGNDAFEVFYYCRDRFAHGDRSRRLAPA